MDECSRSQQEGRCGYQAISSSEAKTRDSRRSDHSRRRGRIPILPQRHVVMDSYKIQRHSYRFD